MLKILQKGNQYQLPLDESAFTGDIAVDSALASVTALVSGRVAAVDAAGYCVLADGDDTAGAVPFGFIINDAAGYFYENKPALASGVVAVTFGNCVVQTDQIDTALTFAPGELLYVGTGAKAGLITNVAPTHSRPFAISASSASAASPTLTLAVL